MVALDEHFHQKIAKAPRRCHCGGEVTQSETSLARRIADILSARCRRSTSISSMFRNRPLFIDYCSLIFERSADAYGNTRIFSAPDSTGNWWGDAAVQSGYGANEIIYFRYRFDPETQDYYVHNRIYSPPLCRWLQRDPIGIPGGINLYRCVESSPVGRMDAWGLWNIKRNGKLTATATSQAGDTISGLGKQAHLNGFEWKKWSRLIKWKISGGLDEAIKCPVEFSIPNLIAIDMGSSVDWNARLFVPWTIFFQFERQAAKIKNAYKACGLDVEQNWDATNRQFQSHLTGKSKSRQLYGYYFYGHGSGTGVINATGLGGVPPGTYSAYGLAIMFRGVCGSLAGSPGQVSYILPSGHTAWTSAGTASVWQPNRSGKVAPGECELRN